MNYKKLYLNLKKEYYKKQFGGLRREQLYHLYNKSIDDFISIDTDDLVEIIKSYNIRYIKGKNKGLYYDIDYSRLENSNDKTTDFIGFTNPNYFDLTTSIQFENSLVSFFKSFDYIKPSEALKAFIIGPTFTECANIIQVSIYHLILNFVGDEKFDDLFGNLLIPFTITPNIFMPILSEIRNKNEDNTYQAIIGNPLYFLFDEIYDLRLENLEHNDIVYIRGVEEYNLKHLSGASIGWNLICDKNESTGETKFIGFGPNEFGTRNGSKTYEEMVKLLIDGYNKPQNNETLKIIEARKKVEELKDSAINAESLKNDIITGFFSRSIIGIQYILRLNQEKLFEFIKRPKYKWYEDENKNLPEENNIPINLLLDSFSTETNDSTFENYIKDNEDRELLYNYMLKFGYKIINKTLESGPIGFVLTGSPGIGKTHLSVALAKFVSNYGIKVTFVDENYLGKKFQESHGQLRDFSLWFNDSDLIILDDINSMYRTSSIFLQQVLEYVIIKSKALLYTSNNILPLIQKNIPIIYPYNYDGAKNFFSLNINTFTYTTPWIDHDINLLDNNEKYNLLFSYSGKKSAGIIIETDIINEQHFIDDFNTITCNTTEFTIVKDWTLTQRFNRYGNYTTVLTANDMQKSNGYPQILKDNYIIMVINEYSYANQFIKILPELHDNSNKIIILTRSVTNFKRLILSIIQDYLNEKNKLKLLARLNIMIPYIFD